jgi:uncharacterized protein YoxC
MGILTTHHHHYHFSDPVTLALLRNLFKTLEKIMSTFDDLKAALDATDAKVTTIKTDVETLLAKLAAIPTGGMTADQQAALDAAVTHAQAIVASLTAVDEEVNPPAPAQG